MGRVSAWEALLLGVVEGLTEFLPVSSTGHLTLLFHLLGLPVEEDPFLKTFLVAIQLGAILAVLLLYGRRLAADRALWLRIAVAFVPTGVIGFFFYPLIKGVILGNDAVVAFFLFFVGAVLLFADRLAERAQYQDVKALPLARVAWIGVFQGLAALFPGTSRSGATILGGLLLGLPTMFAAVGYDLWKSAPEVPEGGWSLLLLGFLAALATALVTVRWMLAFVARHGFRPFALYRMALAAVYAFFFLR